MDKNTLETYEFIPANNSEVEVMRFFVVENDVNYHIPTKSIQHVTQEETNKEEQEGTQSCAMYNIESQQFYVNVDNSTELISVSDEYVLPSTDSNVYANSYLLQSDINTNEERIEDVTVNKLKLENLPITNLTGVNESNKQSDCAEVTISDDQYKIFEKRGWILLESNEKIFLLNTLGLHDITSNDKLVQKLKNESNKLTEINSNSVRGIENSLNINQDYINEYDTTFEHSTESIKPEPDNISITSAIDNNNEEYCDKRETVFQQDKVNLNMNPNDIPMDHTVEITKEQNGSAYRIKTNISFEDVPNKIILGKTSNGKRLVARVVKSRKPMTVSQRIIQNQRLSGTDLSNSQFLGLLKYTLRSNGSTYSTEDIAAARAVVGQLFKVPAIRQSIVGQHLIVTKIRNSKENTGKLKRKLTLVTGKVKASDNSEGTFVHLPNLLQYLVMKSERMDGIGGGANASQNGDITIFHVHESETLCADNSVRVDINLTKRQLVKDSILDRRLLKTYACGACASTFDTADAFKEHQESLCLEMDDNLTIDTDNFTPNKDSVKTDRKKCFTSFQCNAQLSKNKNCEEPHFVPANQIKTEDVQMIEDQFKMKMEKSQLHKCKMCPATFFAPSTLSKHILTKHIK